MPDTQELTAIKLILEDQDSEQYRYIVEKYHRGLIRHIYSLCYDEATAEDIAQEVFLRAFNKLNQYDSTYAFSTWLYKIANNMTYRLLKQAKPTSDIADFEESLASDSLTPSELAERSFSQEKVRQAIAQLPLAYRQVISLYYWEGLSYEEIAEVMEKPVGTIRTWLFRAKDKLRKDLNGQV